jgi:hypothetical protein
MGEGFHSTVQKPLGLECVLFSHSKNLDAIAEKSKSLIRLYALASKADDDSSMYGGP